jgi:hypothetical protein
MPQLNAARLNRSPGENSRAAVFHRATGRTMDNLAAWT